MHIGETNYEAQVWSTVISRLRNPGDSDKPVQLWTDNVGHEIDHSTGSVDYEDGNPDMRLVGAQQDRPLWPNPPGLVYVGQ